MSGWVPLDVAWWEALSASLAKPWPREAMLMDLRVWSDAVRMGRVKRRPSTRQLRERWGATHWAVRQALKAETEWTDPSAAQSPHSRRTVAAQSPHSTASANLDNGADSAQSPHSRRTVAAQSPPHARRRSPTPTPTPSPKDTECDATPAWCRKRFRGASVASKMAHVRAVLAELRQREPRAREIGSDGNARQLDALWRSEGCVALEEWTADVVLVAKAMRECPDPRFARDVRAEGWDAGTDRSASLATLCVQSRWTDRLEIARRWAAGELETRRVSGRVARREFDLNAHLRAIEGGRE